MPYKDKEQQRKYQREAVAKVRKQFFKDKVCCECGGQDNLQLDHINPEDKVSHNIWSWSEIKRKEELAKCQVLCYDCHKIKTKRQLPRGINHPQAKFSESDIQQIKFRVLAGEPANQIAQEFEVHKSTISRIINNLCYN